MATKTMEKLFVHELSDIHSAEKQLTRALPKLSRAASDPDIGEAFDMHLEQTHGQIERIDRIVARLASGSSASSARRGKGGWKRARGIIDTMAEGPMRDAALIGAAEGGVLRDRPLRHAGRHRQSSWVTTKRWNCCCRRSRRSGAPTRS